MLGVSQVSTWGIAAVEEVSVNGWEELVVDVDVWEGLVVPVREVVVMEEVEDVDEDDVVDTVPRA